jgi:hypothetical protein
MTNRRWRASSNEYSPTSLLPYNCWRPASSDEYTNAEAIKCIKRHPKVQSFLFASIAAHRGDISDEPWPVAIVSKIEAPPTDVNHLACTEDDERDID